MIDVMALHQMVDQFYKAHILVVGDLMLDRFIWGKVSRISPEAPVPVVQVTRETAHLGGSANVIANLRALGAQATPIGLIGDDEAGKRLTDELSEMSVSLEGLVLDPDVETIQKSRIIAHNQQVVRVDRETPRTLTSDQETALKERLSQTWGKADALIVSDYGKWVINKTILEMIEQRPDGLFVALDPKDKNFDHYRLADVVTPNHSEAERLSECTINPLEPHSLERAAARIFTRLQCRKLLITLGEHGMAVFTNPDEHKRIATVAREVYDVSGAGDTVIATFTLARAVGADDHQAALLANAAAGVVVAKLGTATLTPNELHRALEQLPDQ